MKISLKQSRRQKPYQCGVPVNTTEKTSLRNRSLPLSSEQRDSVKKMHVKLKPNMTEKEAVKILKRIVTFESAYDDPAYISPWVRKVKRAKPKRVSDRQAKIEVLIHRAEKSKPSKRAQKMLKKI